MSTDTTSDATTTPAAPATTTPAPEAVAPPSGVLTIFHLAANTSPETYRLLADVIGSQKWDGPVILSPEGQIEVESIKADGSRIRPNRLIRTDQDMIKSYGLAVEVHIAPTAAFSRAVWGMNLLAKLLTRISGIDCQVVLAPTEGA